MIRNVFERLNFIIRKSIRNYTHLFRFLAFLLTASLILFFYPSDMHFKYDYRKNKPWLYKDLIAPFDFSINKTDEDIKQEKDIAKQNVLPYYLLDSSLTQTKKNEFKIALQDCQETGIPVNITANEAIKLQSIIDTIYTRGVIQNQSKENNPPQAPLIRLIIHDKAETVRRERFFTILTADEYINTKLAQLGFKEITPIKSFIESFLIQNIVYDGITTAKELETAYDNLSPTYGLIQKGERIISKGELVSLEKYQIIYSLEMQYNGASSKSESGFWVLFGQIFMVVIILFILFFYIYLFDKRVYFRLKRIVLLCSVFLSMVVFASLCQSNFPDYITAFPFCLFAVAYKVFFSSRVSILTYVIGVLLVGSFVSNGFEFVLIQILVGVASILSLKSLHHRAQFVTTAALVFVLYLSIYIVRILMFEGGFDSVDTDQLWLYSISAGLTLLAYPYLYLLERIFRMVTDFTLLELSNTNLPLLRELASKAPGTFYHSIVVANIAEEVIHKINGNMLLVRTGALYHDIGKLANPSFFIENQHGVNPHDNIPPNESAAILINHVTEGIAIARKHNLPDEIMGFIRTHHGTRKTAFFYNKFVLENPEIPANNSFFTYQGPSPRTKEEAVLMLADIFEAATRSMKVPSKENISSFVDNMIEKLIVTQQFNQANITFKDLLVIKESFKSQLVNMYHKRVEYPKSN